MFTEYLNRNKYHVVNDYKEERKKHFLYNYKLAVLKQNGQESLANNLFNNSSQFNHVELEEGTRYEKNDFDVIDEAEAYPIDLAAEKAEIETRVKNLEYIKKTYDIFEYCRGRCKVDNTLLRNFQYHPKANQMCVTDCLNIRFEKFGPEKPSNASTDTETDNKTNKTFVWLA